MGSVRDMQLSNTSTYITFVLYLIVMILVGGYFYNKSKKLEDYLLGGRSMGAWVTALSAQASDMSGWLLMGLPGAIYLFGLNQAWIAIGLAIGTYFNWRLISARLRLYTGATNSLTLSSFFHNRFKDPTGLLRLISSIIVLIFFTVYAAAGLVSAGKLFESVFAMDYITAVFIGTMIMILYTLLGGFLAVCWTDLFQAILMVFAIVAVPVIAYMSIDPAEIELAISLKAGVLDILPTGESSFLVALSLISSLAWGLGYFGQPHILTRFMSVASIKLLPRSRRIAMAWVLISLVGAVLVGLFAIPLYDTLPKGDEEKVLIFLVRDLVNPILAGVLLAAILAAIMSTVDSQLLVSSSTLTEDFYASIINKKASPERLLLVSRLAVVFIAAIAFMLSMNRESNIFNLVTFAWGGFGSSFGPAVIMSLYSRKSTWYSILAGMVTGTIVMLIWYALGLNTYLYEIVVGFTANFLVIFIINAIKPNTDKNIDNEFDVMTSNLKV